MTDGRLLVRARAAERAQGGAPDAVYDAQRERHRLAEITRRDAVLAYAADRADEAARLEAEAAGHAAAAERLDTIAQARAAWLVANAETLSAGEAAVDELIRRGRAPGGESDRTTAEDWLAAEAAARAADDEHRAVTETDVVDDEPAASSNSAGPAEDGQQAQPLTMPEPADRKATAASQPMDSASAEASAMDSAEPAAMAEEAAPSESTRPDAVASPEPIDATPKASGRLSATAAAAEIAAATARASAAMDELADRASQEATASTAVEDDWDYAPTAALDGDRDDLDTGDAHDQVAPADREWSPDHDASSAAGAVLEIGNA
jgi:hypothetical protein